MAEITISFGELFPEEEITSKEIQIPKETIPGEIRDNICYIYSGEEEIQIPLPQNTFRFKISPSGYLLERGLVKKQILINGKPHNIIVDLEAYQESTKDTNSGMTIVTYTNNAANKTIQPGYDAPTRNRVPTTQIIPTTPPTEDPHKDEISRQIIIDNDYKPKT